MKKIFLIVIGILIVIGVAYFLVFTQTDIFVPHYRVSDYSQPYYQNLAQQCESKTSLGCCLASVKTMQSGNYQLASQGKCPDGYKPNTMLCIDSYHWCEPEASAGQNKNSASQTQDVRFTGVIQTVDNQQPVDGNLRVKINDVWIIIGGGEMPVPKPGLVVGFDFNNVQSNVGKRAEVYAKTTGYDQSLTILDGSEYYLKIIQ